MSGHEEIFEYLLNMGHDEEELSRVSKTLRSGGLNNVFLDLGRGEQHHPHSARRHPQPP